MQTAYITHPQCLLHDMGHYHPECPERLRAIEDQLIASGLLGLLSRHEAPPALREHLIRVHDPAYVDEIEASSPHSGTVHLDPDTAMNPHSYRAALHAAGAVVLATDLVLSGRAAMVRRATRRLISAAPGLRCIAPRPTTSPSSRGLGHRPFTAATPVRIRLGTPIVLAQIKSMD